MSAKNIGSDWSGMSFVVAQPGNPLPNWKKAAFIVAGMNRLQSKCIFSSELFGWEILASLSNCCTMQYCKFLPSIVVRRSCWLRRARWNISGRSWKRWVWPTTRWRSSRIHNIGWVTSPTGRSKTWRVWDSRWESLTVDPYFSCPPIFVIPCIIDSSHFRLISLLITFIPDLTFVFTYIHISFLISQIPDITFLISFILKSPRSLFPHFSHSSSNSLLIF